MPVRQDRRSTVSERLAWSTSWVKGQSGFLVNLCLKRPNRVGQKGGGVRGREKRRWRRKNKKRNAVICSSKRIAYEENKIFFPPYFLFLVCVCERACDVRVCCDVFRCVCSYVCMRVGWSTIMRFGPWRTSLGVSTAFHLVWNRISWCSSLFMPG